jgi:Glycogen recognition site of AMP-activated protein kinase
MTTWPAVFRFPARLCPAARSVSLVGQFNGWDPAVHPLRRFPSGDWTIKLCVPPGRLIYTFIVDGMIWLDPEDDERIPNGWGSEYSVRHVSGEPASAAPTTR